MGPWSASKPLHPNCHVAQSVSVLLGVFGPLLPMHPRTGVFLSRRAASPRVETPGSRREALDSGERPFGVVFVSNVGAELASDDLAEAQRIDGSERRNETTREPTRIPW